MNISRTMWTADAGWAPPVKNLPGADQADLVLVFGATAHMKNGILEDAVFHVRGCAKDQDQIRLVGAGQVFYWRRPAGVGGPHGAGDVHDIGPSGNMGDGGPIARWRLP